MSIAGDHLIGTEFLGYRIEALVGRGGMGVVYRAYDLRLKRNVALKLIAPEFSQDDRFRERFLSESELAASLDHPNVIPIYDAGEHEGQLYLAMRYVEGSDLNTLLRKEGLLPAERALVIVSQVAAALDAAHARGLVHRDIKPSNVLLDTQEHVYLADFGLSRRLVEQAPELEATLSLGTPAYVAPEQIEGAEVDAHADVYSLGCLLHECLTGKAPYPRESELAVLWAHLNDPPPSAPGLEEVMAKGLAKRPEERYASCTELVNAAREALGLGARRDRRPFVLAGTGLLIAAAAVATGLVLAFGNDDSTTKADLTIRNNSLVRINPEDSKIGAVTPVGRGPEAVAIGGNTVWTYNWDDRTVSAVDKSTNLVEQTASISGSPPFTIGNSIAGDDDGAWVISSLAGKGLLTHLRLGEFRPRESGFSWDPISVAVGEGAVWVAAKDIRGSAVLKIDPTTGSVMETTRLRGALVDEQSQFRDVQWLAVGNGAVWAVQGGTLFRIDARTGRVTGRLNLPVHEPGGIAAANGAVWVMVFDAIRRNGVVRIDPRNMRLTARVLSPSVAGGSNSASHAGNALAISEDAIWWSGGDAGVVWKIDPRTSKIASTIRVTAPVTSFAMKGPYGIAAGPGGVWVAVRVAP